MMGEPALKTHFTVQEYIAMEQNSLEKHEYHKGEIFAMAGGKPNHSLLASNTIRAIGNALIKNKKPCNTFTGDLQIAMSDEDYSYPDLSVICGKIETYPENPNAAKNPILIVEVLSDSTEKYDRGEKFRKYQQIPSLQEYVLITQDSMRVEVFSKHETIIFWQYRSYENPEEAIELKSIDAQISLQDIYLGWTKTD